MSWIENRWAALRRLEVVHWLALALVALLLGMIALSIFGFRPGHQRITASDGAPAWLVTCSSPGDCVTESAAICPSGWSTLSQAAERGTVTTVTNVGTGNGQSVAIPTTVDTYSGATVIRCKGDELP